jgi:hypothetical protein
MRSYSAMNQPMVIVPFRRESVPGNTDVLMSTICHAAVRPRYLVIPRSVAPDFEIHDIKVGMNSQFLAEGIVPASIFAGDADAVGADADEQDFLRRAQLEVPLPLDLSSAWAGTLITLRMRNISPSARYFYATIFGLPNHPYNSINQEDLARLMRSSG